MVLLLDRGQTREKISVSRGLDAMRSAFAETVDNPTANGLRRRHYAYDEGVSATRANVFSALSADRGYAGVRARIDTVDPERLFQAGAIDSTDAFARQTADGPKAPRGAYLLFDVDSTELVAIQYEDSTDDPLPSERFENAGANRTALNTALGVRSLVGPDPQRLGFLGSGRFAPAHVAALTEALQPIESVAVYSPTPAHRREFADTADSHVDPAVRAVEDARSAVSGSDVVVSCTNSTTPVLYGEWLDPGTTVACLVAMEKHFGRKDQHFSATEVDDTTVRRADMIACNSIEQAKLDEQGVLWDRQQRGLIEWSAVTELADLLADEEGRTSDDEIALFHNNGGQGIADLAVAIEHYELAQAEGIGTEIPFSG